MHQIDKQESLPIFGENLAHSQIAKPIRLKLKDLGDTKWAEIERKKREDKEAKMS